jgi:hypothetical protein
VEPTAGIYRGLRLDRRTTFDARFWLAAAARFGTIQDLTRDALFGTREVLGTLRRGTSAIAAGASGTSATVAGPSSCALISTATVSGINWLGVVGSGTPLPNNRNYLVDVPHTRSSIMSDRLATESTEITPEMVEAGVDILMTDLALLTESADEGLPGRVCMEIFLAMAGKVQTRRQ